MESVHHRILQQEQTSRGDLFRRSEPSGEHAISLHGVFEILDTVSGLHKGRNDQGGGERVDPDPAGGEEIGCGFGYT